MAIDVISAEHVAAADRREAVRASAHQYLPARAQARRATGVAWLLDPAGPWESLRVQVGVAAKGG